MYAHVYAQRRQDLRVRRVPIRFLSDDISYNDFQLRHRLLLQLVLRVRSAPPLPGRLLCLLEHVANSSSIAEIFAAALLREATPDHRAYFVVDTESFVMAHFCPDVFKLKLGEIVKFHDMKTVGHACERLRREMKAATAVQTKYAGNVIRWHICYMYCRRSASVRCHFCVQRE